jgi:signal transduction histidine kinase
MRRRISWLVLATTSTVVVSFVIPLCLLVQNLAQERAMAAAEQEARNATTLVSRLVGRPVELASVFNELDDRGVPTTGVTSPSGLALGDTEGMDTDPFVQQARLDGVSARQMTDEGGEVVVPVLLGGAGDGVETAVVRSRVTEEDMRRGVPQAWAGIIGLGVVLLLLAMLMASWLGRGVSRPLLHVADVAHRMREGDLSARARIRGTEETRELARALNGLAERARELLAAERAAVGDLSHRLRTPVTALRLDAEAVDDTELAHRLQEHIAALQVTIDAIVADARRPVRSDLRSRCEAVTAVRARVSFWEVLAEDQGREMRVVLSPVPLVVPVADDELADVVDVLIDNVFAHTPEGTPFTVGLRHEGDEALIIVADAGPGVAATRDDDRPGTSGLGLDIARRTAEGCGGRLTVSPVTGDNERAAGGTLVEVRLPLVEN